jgi:hypothetical protein
MKALKRLTQALRERGVNAENVFVGFHFALFALAGALILYLVAETFWGAFQLLLWILYILAFIFFTEATVTLLLLGYALWKFARWITPVLGRGITWLLPRFLEAGQPLLNHCAQILAVLALVHAVATLYRTGTTSTHHP